MMSLDKHTKSLPKSDWGNIVKIDVFTPYPPRVPVIMEENFIFKIQTWYIAHFKA